ncbi:MAG: M20 family metallopeptidase [Chloroflexota bacterium]
MEFNPIQNKIIYAIDGAKETILSVSHQIHDHPELGYGEIFASNLLIKTLESQGFKVERGSAGLETAFYARKGTPGGRVLVFCAEYDALPELGHACGHNVIAASALAAGIGLGAALEENLPGEVVVIGTPAEESDGAKSLMVERGVFKDVDVAMMIHPFYGNYVHTESLALDAIKMSFYGKPAHAAMAPWEGKNALDALVLTYTNINALRQHVRPDARMHGIITRGGTAPGIVPDHTEGRFYVRARDRAYLNELLLRVKMCAQAAAVATGTQVEFELFENSMDNMVNNAPLAHRAGDYCEALGAAPFKMAPDSFGSIDMGNVSHVIPGIHMLIDITGGKYAGLHTQEFASIAAQQLADVAILRSGKALALAGYDVIADKVFFEKLKEEFDRSLGD